MKTFRRKTGDKGERIATKYLKKKGYKIIERNYLEKCGEIDIIALKDDILHFVEVKTVSRENRQCSKFWMRSCVICETDEEFRPEENVSFLKIQRLKRVISVFLTKSLFKDHDYQLDVVSVVLRCCAKPDITHIKNVS